MSNQPVTFTTSANGAVQTPAQPEAQAKPADPAPAPQKVEKREASDPLGQPGIKALQAERQAREALERELKPLKDQMDALKGIFGDKRVEGTDIVSALQQQVAQMQRDSLVDRVARRHGITDDADVEFLHNATDEAAMTRLAERLKVPAATPPRTPAPDPAQANHAPALSQDDAEYEAFFPSTPKH